MNPYKAICELLKYFEGELTVQKYGVHYKCALVLVIEALKRVKPFM